MREERIQLVPRTEPRRTAGKVSVIMPVKDTIEYLPESVGSVLAQSYDRFELICVDDGSTDGSLERLRRYANEDERVLVVAPDSGRAGPGAARNRALDLASGDYVAFLDSDDLFHTDAMKLLVARAEETESDIVMGGIEKFSDAGSNEKFLKCTYLDLLPDRVGERVFSWEDIPDLLFELRFVCWNKLYKRSLLEEPSIRFPEGAFYEDLPFHFETLLAARRMSFVEKTVVSNRRLREGATTFVQGGRVFDAIDAMECVEQRLRSVDSRRSPEMATRLRSDFEVFRFRRLLEYLHKNDADHIESFYESLQKAAAALDASQVSSLPEAVQVAHERVLTSRAIEFLAFDAWDARVLAARAAREKRALRSKNRKLKAELKRTTAQVKALREEASNKRWVHRARTRARRLLRGGR